MEQKSHSQEQRDEFTKILDAAARFHQWWIAGEASLKSRQESGEPVQKKAA